MVRLGRCARVAAENHFGVRGQVSVAAGRWHHCVAFHIALEGKWRAGGKRDASVVLPRCVFVAVDTVLAVAAQKNNAEFSVSSEQKARNTKRDLREAVALGLTRV